MPEQNHVEIEKILKQFVSESISSEAFAERLYQDADEFETYFSSFSPMDGYLKEGISLYLFSCDLNSVSGRLNATGAINDFFRHHGIEHQENADFEREFEQLLNAQPKYVSVDTTWLESYYSAFPQWQDENHRVSWLKKRLKEDFRYIGKPPKWIQSPAWPIGENGPYVFIGQLDATALFHDTTYLYVFVEATTGETKIVTQTH